MSPYDKPDARYGRVQDDGTVKEYPSQRAAERAGPMEAIVCWWPDQQKWIYPATGREFKPEDVAGLSPATASTQAWAVLGRAGLDRRLRKVNGVLSRVMQGGLMQTSLHVQKSRVAASWPDLAAEALAGLPNAVRTTQPHRDDEAYNYYFVEVHRRRS